MITLVRQNSNKARLKQLLTKTNNPLIEAVTWESALQKYRAS